MCGIAGFLTFSQLQTNYQSTLKMMADSLHHRGPDEEGYFFKDGIGLCMRRLTIVDQAHGHQPIVSKDNKAALVYNGEIYNHLSLRKIYSLENIDGHSDTQTLFALLNQKGFGAVSEMNGMFSFAYWDDQAQTLTLARDKFGIKPLYYYWDGNIFIFASEIKAILASDLIKKSINQLGIWDYLTRRYVPGPHTIWKNIFKLPAGNILHLKQNGNPVITPFISLEKEEQKINLKESIDLLDEKLDAAVKSHLMSDVPVGVLLSGGLDSALISAYAKKYTPDLKSFTIGFSEDSSANENQMAIETANYFGLSHHSHFISDAEFLNTLETLIYHSDEPLADLASIPLYHICNYAKQHVKVILSGEGADELFGGYEFEKTVANWQPKSFWDKIKHKQPDFRHLSPPEMTDYFTQEEKIELMKGSFFNSTIKIASDKLTHFKTTDPLNQCLYHLCSDWLVEDILMKSDKMSMAASIELRPPFLDLDLSNFAFSLPGNLKVGPYNGKKLVSKKLLKHLAERHLPQHIINRPKKGFAIPVYAWLYEDNKALINTYLSKESSIFNYLDYDVVNALCKKVIMEKDAIMDQHRVWNLIILEIWLRKWT